MSEEPVLSATGLGSLDLSASECVLLVVLCVYVWWTWYSGMPLSLRFDSIPLDPTEDSSARRRDGVLINSVFDYIMENVRGNMGSMGRYRSVSIPDLEERVEMAPTSVTPSVSGILRARLGTLRDLTTLRRASDLYLRTEDGVLYVTGSVSLCTLSAAFRHYSLQAGVFKKSGDLLALEVGKNSFEIFLTIRFDGLECGVRLERISATKFSDVSVNMTGFSVLNPVTCKVAQWIIHSFQGFIKDVVERYARDLVNGAVKDRELIGRLLGYGIAGMVQSCHERGAPEGGGQVCKCAPFGITITFKPCSKCGHKVTVI